MGMLKGVGSDVGTVARSDSKGTRNALAIATGCCLLLSPDDSSDSTMIPIRRFPGFHRHPKRQMARDLTRHRPENQLPTKWSRCRRYSK